MADGNIHDFTSTEVHDFAPATAPVETTHDPRYDIFLEAAAYIEKHGWCQREMQKADGSVCFIGAILCAGGGIDKFYSPRPCPETTFALGILRMGGEYSSIIPWNDKQGRTQEEVIAKLKELARG